MKSLKQIHKTRLSAILFLLFAGTCFSFSQSFSEDLQVFLSEEETAGEGSFHELTLYVIPSKVPYDWSSPRSLHRSYMKNIRRNLLSGQHYLLGHAFLELRSSLIPGKLLTGMRSVSREESRKYVLKEDFGLAILGAELDGRLETSEELEPIREKYAKRDRLAFIRVMLSEDAAARMLAFFDQYVSRYDTPDVDGVPYGGAFWPRFEAEGAGCSAFVVSFLDVAGLLRKFYDDWKISIEIPMDLIGGPYNDGNKVKLKDVRQHHTWADNTEANPDDYAAFEIYDPSVMYQWIMAIYNENKEDDEGFNFLPLDQQNARGILFDARDFTAPQDEPLIIERERPSIFIGHQHSNGIH